MSSNIKYRIINYPIIAMKMDLYLIWDMPSFEQELIDIRECRYVPVTQTVTIRIPEKTDLVVTPNYAVWSKGQNPNDQIVNFLYDDTGYIDKVFTNSNRQKLSPDKTRRNRVNDIKHLIN